MPDPSVSLNGDRRKAYFLEATFVGVTHYLVYANSAKHAREIFRMEGETIDTTTESRGIRSVRRAPEEDR